MSTRKYKSQIGTIPKIVNNFEPKTDNQKLFYNKISDFNNQLILCHGIAGTGKTYVSIYKALQDVLRRGLPYDKLIIINPTVDVGNEDKLGYLPGELQQKIQQYNESTFTILNKIIGKSRANKMISDGKIEIGVLNFLRGTNLENCYVILDEAQNATETQIKMFLTRIGENSKLIVNGDPSQIDLINKSQSGLIKSKNLIKHIEEIKIIEFDHTDVVRHPLVSKIIRAYQKKSTDDQD